MHWIDSADALTIGESRHFDVRIRYRQPLQGATIYMEEQAAYIVFDTPQRGIAAGQFAAWYIENRVVGSGVISA